MSDWRWRLNNIYKITNQKGEAIDFRLNWAQQALLDEWTHLNLILKARQLGFTTFIQLLMLDACLFTKNTRCGTIAHTLDDAKVIFRDKVKFPYDNLPDGLKAHVYPIADSTQEMLFSNNSSIRVGTSMRSGTLQYLHVSEYGKICVKFPEKAREIKTGALNTLQAGQIAIIESTAEGQEGDFYEMCERAQTKQRKKELITPLDFSFHFFPWWRHPLYEIDPAGVEETSQDIKYFNELAEEHGIVLTDRQRAWYVKKAAEQQEDMKREYPSTPEEAFAASVEGAYYGRWMARAEQDGRITSVPHDEAHGVETWWDLGYNDLNCIWFVQRIPPNQIHIIDFYQASGEGMGHYARILTDRQRESGYQYTRHLWPHDGNHHIMDERGRRLSQVMADLGYKADITPRSRNIGDGIDAARTLLGRCWFDASRCAAGIHALKNYRKEWDETLGTFKSHPRHDWASHPADAFRTGAEAGEKNGNWGGYTSDQMAPVLPVA